ncbi:tail fiber assembly protein [Citrobacter freundii]|uniref:Tail fiber assembly protein n=1 Tax=Citrobacter freundii TaxID=546 RepID=A0AAN4ETU2_CITFR|nr:tail fiber assembly protein [Citrobacter freundii]EKW2107601.1 tail fiber assembly protein [Citrobacter freundii]EKX5202217.1 tail fiber assembly protein [Citrobacter freundii]
MMEFGYSKTTNAFYDMSRKDLFIEAGTWPGDVVEVEQNIADEFMQTPPSGKLRVSGDDGLPAWGDIPPPTRDKLIAIAENERQRLLAYADVVMLDWRTELMLGEISDTNRAKLSAWLAYKNEVKEVDVTIDPENVIWPVPPEA